MNPSILTIEIHCNDEFGKLLMIQIHLICIVVGLCLAFNNVSKQKIIGNN